jgi:hypothetical protein
MWIIEIIEIDVVSNSGKKVGLRIDTESTCFHVVTYHHEFF